MIVPFSVSDFLDRAVTVYGERTGVVDEPDQPAPSLGELTYAELGVRARRMAARLDQLGVGVGERVAVVSHNSARLLAAFFGVAGYGRVLVPVNFRLRPDEVRYIVGHSGAKVLYVDPELDEALASVEAEHRFVLGDDDALFAGEDVEPQPWEPDENATACINYTSGHHRPPQGRPDHPPQHLGQRGHLRAARRRHRPRRLPAHPADVPRERLGDAVRDDRAGRAAGRAAQGRRRRDPAPGRAARRHRHVRRPGGRGGGAGGRPGLGGRDPRPRPGADHHGRGPAADQDRGPGRGGARLGVRADLRAHRDLAAADVQPDPRGVGRPRRRGAGPAADPGGRAGARRTPGGRQGGRGARPLQRRARGLLGPAGGVGPVARGRLVPHR